MPRFDIVKNITPPPTFRAQSIIGNFDIDPSHIDEHFAGEIAIEDKPWNVGIIVGGSGTGKTTIARECFGAEYIASYEYSSACVLDDMPKNVSVKDIEKTFTTVGFASPPSWLKPYSVLSNGEKMRVDLARAILEDREIIVFDEFTSVVDRTVGKTASLAIQKAIRKQNKKFIAVSCHRDVIEWLMPDWVYDTDEKRFFGMRGAALLPESTSKYIGLATQIKRECGKYLGNITI